MPKKVYWRFQQAMGLFSGVYQPGQSLKESLKQLNDNFPTKLGNADLLMQGLRHVFPGYTITPQEQAEAPQRREISATARTTMFTLIHNRQTEFSLKEEGLTFERGFDMLFDYSGSTSAKEWNDQVRYLFSKKGSEYPNGSKEQRGKMIAQFIDRLMNTDFDRLYHLSDRDLAKEFGQLYSLCTFLTEGGDALLKLEGDVYTLPDGYVDKVKELRAAHQTMIGSLRGRFEYIAQPEYEILPYERMRLAPEQFFDFYVEDLDAPSDWVPLHTLIDEDSHISLFFDCASRQHDLFRGSILDRINQEIRKLNLPEELLNPPVYDNNGNKVSLPLLDLSLPDGKALSVEALHPEQTICFTNPITNQQNCIWLNGKDYTLIDFTQMPDPLKTDAEKALKELEAADPWYIRNFTGSNHYKELKESMKSVADFMQRVSKSPTSEEREELKTLLGNLTQKQAAYAGNKVELHESTKDSERARINASNIVKKYIDDANFLLGGYENAISARAALKKAMNDARSDAMEAQADAENNYQRPRNITNESVHARAATVKTENAMQDENLSVWRAYGRGLPLQDPLSTLGYDIHTLGYLNDTPNVLKTMAWMVTYDMIVRERIGQEAGVVGPIEDAYRAGPDKFIVGLEKTQTLQKVAASVEKNGELRNFMTSTIGQNIQKLANSVWSEARGIPVPDDPMQEAPQTEKKKLTLDEAIKNQEDVIQNQSVKPREPAQGPLNIG